MRKKKSKQVIIKNKLVKCEKCNFPYYVWIDPPEEFIVTVDSAGKATENADKSDKNVYKIISIDDDNRVVKTIDLDQRFVSFHKDQLILHRDIEKRASFERISEMYSNKLFKKMKSKKRAK